MMLSLSAKFQPLPYDHTEKSSVPIQRVRQPNPPPITHTNYSFPYTKHQIIPIDYLSKNPHHHIIISLPSPNISPPHHHIIIPTFPQYLPFISPSPLPHPPHIQQMPHPQLLLVVLLHLPTHQHRPSRIKRLQSHLLALKHRNTQ